MCLQPIELQFISRLWRSLIKGNMFHSWSSWSYHYIDIEGSHLITSRVNHAVRETYFYWGAEQTNKTTWSHGAKSLWWSMMLQIWCCCKEVTKSKTWEVSPIFTAFPHQLWRWNIRCLRSQWGGTDVLYKMTMAGPAAPLMTVCASGWWCRANQSILKYVVYNTEGRKKAEEGRDVWLNRPVGLFWVKGLNYLFCYYFSGDAVWKQILDVWNLTWLKCLCLSFFFSFSLSQFCCLIWDLVVKIYTLHSSV